VAGRCASLSNEAIGGARSMGTVMGMGQGAGVADFLEHVRTARGPVFETSEMRGAGN
jgi:hypothetical protein